MELKGRNLQIQMRGGDVKLLQSRLQRLGYAVRAEEAEEQFFGEATEKAVLEFQEKHGVETTGVVYRITVGRSMITPYISLAAYASKGAPYRISNRLQYRALMLWKGGKNDGNWN